MKRLMNRSLFLGVALGLILQLIPSALARAQAMALTDEQVKERLGFIENALKAGEPNAKNWYYGWLVVDAAGAAGGGILAWSNWSNTKLVNGQTVRNRTFAQDMLVSGAASALDLGYILIKPFVPAHASGKLSSLPENTPEERRAKLEKAEEMLRRCARSEASGRSLTTHLLNIGENAAGALVLKAGFHQSWRNAIIAFVGGEAESLLSIFTQPMRATRDLNDYETKYLGKKGISLPERQERKWTLGIWPGGATFTYEF